MDQDATLKEYVWIPLVPFLDAKDVRSLMCLCRWMKGLMERCCDVVSLTASCFDGRSDFFYKERSFSEFRLKSTGLWFRFSGTYIPLGFKNHRETNLNVNLNYYC